MATTILGRNIHRIRAKLINLPSLDNVLFYQNKLIDAIEKLRKNIHALSKSLVEWSKCESNQAFYDVFTNWLNLDDALCLLIKDLHNQCTDFRWNFKMIKEKHKKIDVLRKKKEAKTTEIGRLRKRINTLKRVGVKRKELYETPEFELKKALVDLDQLAATLRTEINNSEITKARMLKDTLTAYSHRWLKFTIDSQHIFSAQYQIASEMTGKPERQHYKSMDVNQLLVNNTLRKLNLAIPETDPCHSPPPKISQAGSIKSKFRKIRPECSRRLPAIPTNKQDSSPDTRKEDKQGEPLEVTLVNEDLSPICDSPAENDKTPLALESAQCTTGHVDSLEPVNQDTSTDLDDKEKKLEDCMLDCTIYSSLTSLEEEDEDEEEEEEEQEEEEEEFGSDDDDYVVPNSYEEEGDDNTSPLIKKTRSPPGSVSLEKLESISVPVSTLEDSYLQIECDDNRVYQDIELISPQGNQSEVRLRQDMGAQYVRDDVARDIFNQSDSDSSQLSTGHQSRPTSLEVSQTDYEIVGKTDDSIYAVYLPDMPNCGKRSEDSHEENVTQECGKVLSKSESEAAGNDSKTCVHESELSRSSRTTSSDDAIYQESVRASVFESNPDVYDASLPRRRSKALSSLKIKRPVFQRLLHRKVPNTSSGYDSSPRSPTIIDEGDHNNIAACSKRPGDKSQNQVTKPPLKKKPNFVKPKKRNNETKP